MEVEPIGSIHGRVTESPADVWATKLATKLDEMRKTASSATTSPNVATSSTYTPAVLANAASFQMYSQLGAVSSLDGHGTHAHRTFDEAPDDIKAVDATHGATVSTVA